MLLRPRFGDLFGLACSSLLGSALAGCASVSVPVDASSAPDVQMLDGARPIDAANVDAGEDARSPSDAEAIDAARSGDAGHDAGHATGHDAGHVVHGFPGNYSSPTIVRVGSTYHVWFAQQDIGGHHYHTPHATFTEDGDFDFVGEALPRMGAEAEAGGVTWAPGVARIDASHWMLYYTAHLVGTPEKKCLFRAHASSAAGPFVDDFAHPLYCAPDSLWSIDAYPVANASGDWYLGARIDQPGGINTIQVRGLDATGEQFASGSSWVELTHNCPSCWEQPVMENAGIVHLVPPSGPGHWFVFYSGRAWDGDSYAVGYADCGTDLAGGACTRVTTTGPWLASSATHGVFGPGTPTFYTDTSGQMMMSVQAWEHTGGTGNPANHGQIMRTYRITVDDAYLPSAALVRVDL